MTNLEKILSTLRHAATPLDDDELARRARISPRQTVNQICRGLARDGVIERVYGPDGKFVNSLRGRDARDASEPSPTHGPPQSEPIVESALPPGDSSEQRRAERVMLDLLSARYALALNPRPLTFPDGVRVEIDGADEDMKVLVECWAHQGAAKAAQKLKLVNDAVKLHWVGSTLPLTPRKILCVTDVAAVRHLAGRSWQAQAIRELGVEIEVIELPEAIRSAVAAAQERQYR